MFLYELVDFFGSFVVVEVAALQRQSFEECTYEATKDLELRHLDETDRLAIGLQSAEGILFVDFWVVAKGAKHDFVVFCELFDLVKGP